MESTSGRFAGHVIDDETASEGTYRGEVLETEPVAAQVEPVSPVFAYNEPEDEPVAVYPLLAPIEAAAVEEEPTLVESPIFAYEAPVAPSEVESADEEVFVNPAAFTPRVQKGPTAVGVAPQTENLFADEVLADEPIARGNKKAGVAKRSKKGDAAVSAAIFADAAANSRPRTVFDDPDAKMEPTVTEPDRLPPLNEKPRRSRPDGSPSMAQKVGGFFGSLSRVLVGVIVALLFGGLVAGFIVAAFGPWQVTNMGVVSRGLDSPLNALPAGTEITMTRLGTVKPSGIAGLFPVALQTARAVVEAPTQNSKGEFAGYHVRCLGGSCPAGAVANIPVSAILGSGRSAF